MHDDGSHPVLGIIRRNAAAGDVSRATDGQLLRQFAALRDEAAFEVLVHRHGAMVFRVCRTVLRDSHSVEDAFQATFLVLVRKAGSIGRPERLANWLYGVAYRVALRARKVKVRRDAREQPGVEALAPAVNAETAEPDVPPLLHDELRRLPAKYRSPLVLCYLEGRTNEEAARQLQWPVGTLKVRLLRGREMLRTRLARRGLGLTATAAAALMSEGTASAVPPPLVDSTVHGALAFAAGRPTATGPPSAAAVALTEGVLKTMWWNRVSIVAALLIAGLLGTGAGVFTVRALAGDSTPAPNDPKKENKKVKTDAETLQGAWAIATLEIDGSKFPDGAFKGSKIIVTGDKFTTISMGATYKGTFKVDAAASPKTIDMTFTEGPEKGTTALGLYELDGDNWKICLAVTAKERPKAFATKPGSGFALETLTREK